MKTLEDVYKFVRLNDIESAGDVIFGDINDMLCEGQFNDIDAILDAVDLERIPVTLMRSFLTITHAGKPHLKRRDAFYERVYPVVEKRGVEKAKRILSRLE